MKNYIKEAEKNCISIAKEMDDMLKVVDGLMHFGYKFFSDYDSSRNTFFEGVINIRNAIYAKSCESISKCFLFAGVGGERALEYSKERFNKNFGEDHKYAIMHFLDKYGQHPSWFTAQDEKEFRKQAVEKIKE